MKHVNRIYTFAVQSYEDDTMYWPELFSNLTLDTKFV